jgi:hypothetical protein
VGQTTVVRGLPIFLRRAFFNPDANAAQLSPLATGARAERRGCRILYLMGAP